MSVAQFNDIRGIHYLPVGDINMVDGTRPYIYLMEFIKS